MIYYLGSPAHPKRKEKKKGTVNDKDGVFNICLLNWGGDFGTPPYHLHCTFNFRKVECEW